MSIAKNLWPQWDLKIMTEEEFGKDYAELETTDNANIDDVKKERMIRATAILK